MLQYTEIGSEFHLMPFEQGKGLSLPREGTLVFSGRTAIESVLRQLPNAKTALLPSYCCDSMIEPFRKAGIKFTFYDVNYDDGIRISLAGKADILLWCDYFGFLSEMPDFDGIVIEDITHSLLSDCQFHEKSDYLVASLRKWMPIYCGGYCSVPVAGYSVPPDIFIAGRDNAMRQKALYLSEHGSDKKKDFLPLFGQMNKWLEDNYSDHLIDSFSEEYLRKADISEQKKLRRRNAGILYDGLKDKVKFLFPKELMDCPLFVPVLLNNRDSIKKRLAENGIYCPSHWPHPKADCSSNLYETELSLVCDQRYSQDDMERIVRTLLELI